MNAFKPPTPDRTARRPFFGTRFSHLVGKPFKSFVYSGLCAAEMAKSIYPSLGALQLVAYFAFSLVEYQVSLYCTP